MNNEKIKNNFLTFAQVVSIPYMIIHTIVLIYMVISTGLLEIFTYTTNITILMVAFAYALRLENKYLNAIACVSFLQFYFIDFGIHLVLAITQTIIILMKVSFSERAIIGGFIFWSLYMFLFDDVIRIIDSMLIPIPDRVTFTVSVLWLLFISTLIVYAVKRKEKCLVHDIPMVIKK